MCIGKWFVFAPWRKKKYVIAQQLLCLSLSVFFPFFFLCKPGQASSTLDGVLLSRRRFASAQRQLVRSVVLVVMALVRRVARDGKQADANHTQTNNHKQTFCPRVHVEGLVLRACNDQHDERGDPRHEAQEEEECRPVPIHLCQ